MRTLIIGALAVTMAGCSSRMPPYANTLSETGAVACSEPAARPVEPVAASFSPGPAIAKLPPRNAASRKPPSSASSKRSSPPGNVHAGSTHDEIAALRSGGGAVASPKTPTLQQQVEAATAVAERIVPVPGAVPPNEPDSRVALVMTPAAVKSITDLSGKVVALDDRHAASRNKIWIAMVAAGAARVQLSESEAKPVDRLIHGEVPGAVLALVSPEAAASFPDIAGYRVFRTPLSLRSINTEQGKP